MSRDRAAPACIALALLAWLGASSLAAAEPATGQAAPAGGDDKRAVPDYDGRDQPTTAGDVLIWVPRLALSPLYVVSELLVRRPLGFLITNAERAHVPEAVFDFFTIGPDHSAGIFPIAFIDFGFDPSVGVYVFWNDAFVKGHALRLRASTWGEDWLAASIVDRWELGSGRQLALELSGVRRPDYAFYGVGPNSRAHDLSRYGSTRFDGHLAYALDLWRGSSFAVALGARSVSFHEGGYDQDPTLGQRARSTAFDTPDGYESGYTALYERMQVAADTRQPQPANGSGVRIEADIEHDSDVRRDPGSGFVRYGAVLGGFYDLDDHNRVVSLALSSAFADPLGSRPVPFSELVAVGGPSNMRGFVPGRLLGRSSAVMTLHYRWPIWVLLAGSIQLSVGNVFGPHLRDFDPGLLRFSGAIGVEAFGSSDSALELLFGVGSETFDRGGEIESIRFAVGTNHGF